MVETGEAITQGGFVGLAAGADGRPQVASLQWNARGFGLRPAGRAFNRVALFADKPRAQLELPLPPGVWNLVFLRHGWSGQILIRDAAAYTIHDLFRAPPDHDEYAVTVTSIGPQIPVFVEVVQQRNPNAIANQVWMLEVRKPPSVYYPEAGRVVSPSCRLIDGKYGHFLALRTDVGVAEELAATGVWEQKEVDLFTRLVRPGEITFDVGANIGHHAVVLSKLVGDAGSVVAFEPQMQMFNLLNANLVLNRCRNALPFRAAVGNCSGKIRMSPISYDDFVPFGSLGVSNEPANAGKGESVEVVRLDDFVPALELGEAPISLMKVDVQSYELFVFQGARELLRRAQPSISFEVSPFWMRRAAYDWRDILTMLESLSYAFYDELGKPLTIPQWDGESRAEWQFLAVAERYRDRLG